MELEDATCYCQISEAASVWPQWPRQVAALDAGALHHHITQQGQHRSPISIITFQKKFWKVLSKKIKNYFLETYSAFQLEQTFLDFIKQSRGHSQLHGSHRFLESMIWN